jgi:hypothetical protein
LPDGNRVQLWSGCHSNRIEGHCQQRSDHHRIAGVTGLGQRIVDIGTAQDMNDTWAWNGDDWTQLP